MISTINTSFTNIYNKEIIIEETNKENFNLVLVNLLKKL